MKFLRQKANLALGQRVIAPFFVKNTTVSSPGVICAINDEANQVRVYHPSALELLSDKIEGAKPGDSVDVKIDRHGNTKPGVVVSLEGKSCRVIRVDQLASLPVFPSEALDLIEDEGEEEGDEGVGSSEDKRAALEKLGKALLVQKAEELKITMTGKEKKEELIQMILAAS